MTHRGLRCAVLAALLALPGCRGEGEPERAAPSPPAAPPAVTEPLPPPVEPAVPTTQPEPEPAAAPPELVMVVHLAGRERLGEDPLVPARQALSRCRRFARSISQPTFASCWSYGQGSAEGCLEPASECGLAAARGARARHGHPAPCAFVPAGAWRKRCEAMVSETEACAAPPCELASGTHDQCRVWNALDGTRTGRECPRAMPKAVVDPGEAVAWVAVEDGADTGDAPLPGDMAFGREPTAVQLVNPLDEAIACYWEPGAERLPAIPLTLLPGLSLVTVDLAAVPVPAGVDVAVYGAQRARVTCWPPVAAAD